jgi:hypothetical protein
MRTPLLVKSEAFIDEVIYLVLFVKGKSKLKSILADQISQQPENCENRNDPDLVHAFLKKWWVESDFKAPLRLNETHQ